MIVTRVATSRRADAVGAAAEGFDVRAVFRCVGLLAIVGVIEGWGPFGVIGSLLP